MDATTSTDPASRARSHRVVMIEDHEMVAAALGAALESHADLSVLDVSPSIELGLASVSRHQPDVVVTDLRLSDGIITDHLGEMRRTSPASAVLLMTGSPTEKALLDALEAGVTGFVDKARPLAEFVDAVRRVGGGELVVSPSLAPALLAHLGGRGRPARGALTRRELEVLQQLAQGRSTSSIAEALSLSANTVRNHIAAAMSKLAAHSRLEAVTEATRRGLIAPF